jgi:CRP/FNR family transcriptional regulator
VEVFSILSVLFSEWINKYDVWQKFIFNLVSERLSYIISVVEEKAFKHIYVGISERLSKSYEENGNPIKITHQELASDIGSSREVISRILKNFDEKQIVTISRGSIDIVDMNFLKEYSNKF